MLAHTIVNYVANDPSVQILAEPGTEGARSWISNNVMPVIFVVIGCVAGMAAIARNFSRLLIIAACACIVMAIVTVSGSKESQATIGTFILRSLGLA